MVRKGRLLFNKAHPTNETGLPISSGEPAAEPDVPTEDRSSPPFRVRSPGPLESARLNAWKTENVIATADKILRRAMDYKFAEEPVRHQREPLGYKNGEPYYHQRPRSDRGKIDDRWPNATDLTSSPIPQSSPTCDVADVFVPRLSPGPRSIRYTRPPWNKPERDNPSETGEEETDEENANPRFSPEQVPPVAAKRTPPPLRPARREWRWTIKPEIDRLEVVEEGEADEGMRSPASPTKEVLQETASEFVLPESAVAEIEEEILEQGPIGPLMYPTPNNPRHTEVEKETGAVKPRSSPGGIRTQEELTEGSEAIVPGYVVASQEEMGEKKGRVVAVGGKDQPQPQVDVVWKRPGTSLAAVDAQPFFTPLVGSLEMQGSLPSRFMDEETAATVAAAHTLVALSRFPQASQPPLKTIPTQHYESTVCPQCSVSLYQLKMLSGSPPERDDALLRAHVEVCLKDQHQGWGDNGVIDAHFSGDPSGEGADTEIGVEVRDGSSPKIQRNSHPEKDEGSAGMPLFAAMAPVSTTAASQRNWEELEKLAIIRLATAKMDSQARESFPTEMGKSRQRKAFAQSRGPTDREDPVAYEGQKEAVIYDYEYDRHLSKRGYQDPISQRSATSSRQAGVANWDERLNVKPSASYGSQNETPPAGRTALIAKRRPTTKHDVHSTTAAVPGTSAAPDGTAAGYSTADVVEYGRKAVTGGAPTPPPSPVDMATLAYVKGGHGRKVKDGRRPVHVNGQLPATTRSGPFKKDGKTAPQPDHPIPASQSGPPVTRTHRKRSRLEKEAVAEAPPAKLQALHAAATAAYNTTAAGADAQRDGARTGLKIRIPMAAVRSAFRAAHNRDKTPAEGGVKAAQSAGVGDGGRGFAAIAAMDAITMGKGGEDGRGKDHGRGF